MLGIYTNSYEGEFADGVTPPITHEDICFEIVAFEMTRILNRHEGEKAFILGSS
jgi:hypothetical protein